MHLEEYASLTVEELGSIVEGFKKSKKAVVLGHNYQVPEVQMLADHLGDSLRLAQLATKTDAELIVLCGVRFMAESAAILNPGKRVVIPSLEAGCPMADMATPEQVEAERKKHPDAAVVSYVNTSAEVKAVSDVCCTSSNAVQVVAAVDADEVIFVPDRNLGAYVASKTSKRIILWEGHCYVHDMFGVEDIRLARGAHPGVPAVVHPECPPVVIDEADFVASTGGMMKLAAEHDELIVGTEIGLVERMNREYPDRNFYPLSAFAVCRDMKMTDLPRLAFALEHEQYVVEVPEETRVRAERALIRMLEMSPGLKGPSS
jgi:quinolinate synthase